MIVFSYLDFFPTDDRSLNMPIKLHLKSFSEGELKARHKYELIHPPLILRDGRPSCLIIPLDMRETKTDQEIKRCRSGQNKDFAGGAGVGRGPPCSSLNLLGEGKGRKTTGSTQSVPDIGCTI
jgi:hypothetical protein